MTVYTARAQDKVDEIPMDEASKSEIAQKYREMDGDYLIQDNAPFGDKIFVTEMKETEKTEQARFKFYADEAVYNKAEFQVQEEDGEKALKAVDSESSDAVEGVQDYYWIEDTETGRKFQVPDHPTGTEIMMELVESETPLEDLKNREDVEEVEEKQEVYE